LTSVLGAVFLTNYRIVFKGNPIDPFVNELAVVRSFPVTSLTREKRFTLHEYVSEIDQTLKEGIQLRSSTFQLIRAAFDDEVTAEEIETFRKLIHKVQFPPTLWHYFAFRGHITLATEQLVKDKDKNVKYSTIRGFAKTTLKNAAKATGLKTKSKKGPKYMLPGNMLPMHGRLSISENLHQQQQEGGGRLREEDEGSELSDQLTLPFQPASFRPSGPLDAKELERLAESRYYRDWERLGLGRLDTLNAYKSTTLTAQPTESTRISLVNVRFSLCKSFPPLLVVPGRISDESLRRFARFYRQSRFPVVTWRHVTSRALLLRGAAFYGKSVMDKLRRTHQVRFQQLFLYSIVVSVFSARLYHSVFSLWLLNYKIDMLLDQNRNQ
jgi:myotubularin-related protein 5/13